MNASRSGSIPWPPLLAAGLWLAVVAVALATRPILPVDETRYLAVAWEMWLTGDFLVPHLNGEPYSHKPPLLFWLINLGWAVAGADAAWPRLVAPLFALANLFLAARLARDLWGEAGAVVDGAPLILLGSVVWTLFTTLTMFDMILAFCTLVGLIGTVRAWRRGGATGFTLLGVAVGLGLLAKGPAILVHTLPAALLAPLWGRRLAPGPASTPLTAAGRGWPAWYGGIVAAVVLGAAIGLAWAVPASQAGGEAYGNAILWGQTTGRVVSSFAHERPVWWYLPWLPVLVLPWLAWPVLWRGARGFAATLTDGGTRLCLCWFVPTLIVFSLISGKQIHYLLPALPALALLVGHLVSVGNVAAENLRDRIVPATLFILVGVAAFALHAIATPDKLAELAMSLEPGWFLALAGAGLIAAVVPWRSRIAAIAVLAALSVTGVSAIHLAVRPVLATAFDLVPVAARLAEWERQGVALAHFGKYHGQFHFLGRLEKPLAVIGLLHPDEDVWLKANPTGKVVSYHRILPQEAPPVLVHPFRRGFVVVWDAATMIAHPGIADRDS